MMFVAIPAIYIYDEVDIVRQSSYDGMGCRVNRKLAVPLAIEGFRKDDENRPTLIRIIKESDEYAEDAEVLRRLSENRMRLDNLSRDIEEDFDDVDTSDIAMELDYMKATIQLGILEVTGELEESPTAEELFETEVALQEEAFA